MQTNPPPALNLTIETDASLLSRGAVAEGVSTGGLWSQEEHSRHINHLEMLGAVLAIHWYTKDRVVSHVRLKMDNQTAICHINHMGGTQCLTRSDSACKLWEWCLQRGIILSAEHLPGSSIVIVDWESNHQPSGGWTERCSQQ